MGAAICGGLAAFVGFAFRLPVDRVVRRNGDKNIQASRAAAVPPATELISSKPSPSVNRIG